MSEERTLWGMGDATAFRIPAGKPGYGHVQGW
jgi:hypothetical protein